MIIAPRWHKHSSSGAHRPSDVAVTVNIIGQFNLIAVNPIIECVSRDLVTEYCEHLESSAVHTGHPFFLETLQGHSNRSLPHLPFHIHAQPIVSKFLTSNIEVGLCIPQAFMVKRCRSYQMSEVLPNVRINKGVSLRRILNFLLLSDAFLYRLARGIPVNEGVLYPLQSKVTTPPPLLR